MEDLEANYQKLNADFHEEKNRAQEILSKNESLISNLNDQIVNLNRK